MHIARARVGTRLLSWLGIAVGIGIAPTASAATLALESASLELQVGPLAVVHAVWDGTGSADVDFLGGSNIQVISGLSASVLGFNEALSNPESWFPFEQLVLNGANGSGSFISLDTPAGGGDMAILGGAGLCFIGCSNGVGGANFVVPLSVGTNGWGFGGGTPIVTPGPDDQPIIVTITGSSWTTGNVAVGNGSVSGTPAFGRSVTLVTALGFAWQSKEAGSSIVDAPGYAKLTLTFVPEPGTLLLVSAGLAALGVGQRVRIEARS